MDDTGIQVSLLGPVQVRRDGAVVPVSGRATVVVATLALHAGRSVSLDMLADRVWGERLPSRVPGSLASHVTRLRRILGGSLIRTSVTGYLLDLDPDRIDLLRLRRMVGEAERLADPIRARALLGEALEYWRGEPLDGLPSDTLRRDVAPALVEELLSALQLRIEWDLADGPKPGLVAELRALTARYPERETLWRQLMAALAATGRHSDAMEAYHQLRAVLREGFGADPSPQLREAYQRLLLQQRATTAHSDDGAQPAGTGVPADDRAAPPVQRPRRDLPRDIAEFTGREREVRQLLAGAPVSDEPTDPVLVWAIDGMAGVGKTVLAVHAAHLLAPGYPDGQLYVDLRGSTDGEAPTDPAATLDTLLRSIGVAGTRVPDGLDERAALWRSELAGRRVLVVLDNAAAADGVQPLIPGTGGCLTIVTSRLRLTDLDGARHMSLDVLPPADALTLFGAVAGTRRVAREPDAAARVLRLCGHLPLAIRIAGARLAAREAWTVDHLAERLSDHDRRLDELSAGSHSAASAFSVSYRQLRPARQRMFRLLSLCPGTDLDAYLAAAAAAVTVREAEQVLEDLVDSHLLQQPALGRYRFHDLLHEYARTLANTEESVEDRRTAVGRILDYYLWVANLARDHLPKGGFPRPVTVECPPAHWPDVEDPGRALAWYEIERANLVIAVGYAATHDWDRHAWQLCGPLGRFLRLRGYHTDWIGIQQLGLGAAERLGDRLAQADALRTLGVAAQGSGHVDQALEWYGRALRLYQTLHERSAEGSTLSNIGLALETSGRSAEAVEHHERALAVYRDDGVYEASMHTNMAMSYRALGRLHEALDHNRRAYELYTHVGDLRGRGGALSNLALVHASLGHAEEAVACHRQAIELMRAVGDEVGECDVRNDFGATLCTLRRFDEAHRVYRQALADARRIADPYLQAIAHEGIAEALYESDPAACRRHLQRALTMLAELNNPQVQRIRARLEALDRR